MSPTKDEVAVDAFDNSRHGEMDGGFVCRMRVDMTEIAEKEIDNMEEELLNRGT